jgi:hypothetical protein
MIGRPERVSRSNLPKILLIPCGGLNEAIKPPDLTHISAATDGGDDLQPAVIRIGNSWVHLGLALIQIGAGDRLPFGCAVLVIIVLSLLLWAILLILLFWLLHYIGGARGDMKRLAVMRSCRSASTPILPQG